MRGDALGGWSAGWSCGRVGGRVGLVLAVSSEVDGPPQPAEYNSRRPPPNFRDVNVTTPYHAVPCASCLTTSAPLPVIATPGLLGVA